MDVGWKVVLIATAYNLLFEYSVRSIYDLIARPFLPLILFLTYFSFFIIIYNFKERFRPADYQLCMFVMALSILYSVFFLPGTYFFIEPKIFGVNWLLFIWIHLFWWSIFQTIMPFYIARRLGFEGVSGHPTSKLWLLLALVIYISTGLFFKAKVYYPPVEARGAGLALIIAFSLLFMLWKDKNRRNHIESGYSKLIDLLALLTIIVMIVCVFFVPYTPSKILYHSINKTGENIMAVWSTFTTILLIFYRIATRKPIPI